MNTAVLLLSLALSASALSAAEWTSAEALVAQGKWDEARRAYLKLHSTLEQSLGPEHPQTVLALANACDAAVPMASRLDSYALCLRALALREKVLGRDSPETAKTLSDLALLYSADNDLNRATKLLERALRIAGPADSAGIMNNLAYIYFKRGKYDRSREMFERAVNAIDNGAAPATEDLPTILGNLGAAELAAHDPESARRHFRRALTLSATNQKAANGLAMAESALARR